MLAIRARRKLKKKLERTGITMSLAALTALLESEAEAAAKVADAAVSSFSPSTASPAVRGLADRLVRQMAWQAALKTAGIATVAAALIGGGGLMGLTVRIVIRARGEHGDDTHYWDNIRVWGVKNPDWPAVPGVSNILVTTDRMIEYTNNTPAACGFYRVRARLE